VSRACDLVGVGQHEVVNAHSNLCGEFEEMTDSCAGFLYLHLGLTFSERGLHVPGGLEERTRENSENRYGAGHAPIYRPAV
jgi:hypothetical protein